jgi:hypothetical protein
MKSKTLAITTETEPHAENGGFEQHETLAKCSCAPMEIMGGGIWLDPTCPVHFPSARPIKPHCTCPFNEELCAVHGDEFEDEQPTRPRGFWL